MPFKHEKLIIELVRKGVAERGVLWAPKPGEKFLDFLNSQHDTAKVNGRGFCKVALPPNHVAAKRERIKPFYSRKKYGKVKTVFIKRISADSEIRNIYLNNPSKTEKTEINCPGTDLEDMSDDDLVTMIMTCLGKISDASNLFRPYLIEEDDILISDDSLFGMPMNNLDTPLSKIMGSRSKGITTPYRYVGSECSVFGLHIEDLLGINSWNELLFGAAKVWIFIPRTEYKKVVQNMAWDLQHAKKGVPTCVAFHKDAWINLDQLIDWDVKFEIVVQRVGDGICTADLAFHQGINLGSNYASAINLILNNYMRAITLDGSRMGCYCKKKGDGYVNLTSDQFQVLMKARENVRELEEDHIERPSGSSVQTPEDFQSANMTDISSNTSTSGSTRKKLCTFEGCGKLITASNYRRHLSTHSTGKPFLCSTCGKSFLLEEYLKSHILTHQPKGSFDCIFCNRNFKHKCNMKSHEKVCKEREV